MVASSRAKVADSLGWVWERCRRDLAFYGEVVHGWRAMSHHVPWHRALQDKNLNHLLIIAPPASAKSSHVGVSFTAWSIGHRPDLHVGYATNSDLLSYTRSMAVRDTIERNEVYQAVFPNVRPNAARGWGQADWFVERPDLSDPHPTFRACGLFGSITGFRFDLLVVDDVCTQESVATQLQRDKTWEWFNQTLLTRMTPDGRVVVIMTRWHHDDLAAHLIEQGWPTLHTEAIHDGESYWPEEWPLSKLLAIRDGELREDGSRKGGIGSRAFESHYQGRPTAEVGNILKWFPTYDQVPPLKMKLQRWDTAFSDKQTADYSACVNLGVGQDNNIYVLSAWRDRLEIPELIQAMKALAEREKPDYTIVEETATALRVVEQVKKLTMLPIITDRQKMRVDKVARVNAAAPEFESGRVLFPARYHRNWGPWVEEVIEECKGFPFGAHDDYVDALCCGVLDVVERIDRQTPMRYRIR